MSTKVQHPRPVVVWIAGIVWAFIVLGCVWPGQGLRSILSDVRWWTLLGLHLFVLVGMFLRWKWSRWLAVILLVAFALYGFCLPVAESANKPTGIIAGYVVCSLMLVLASLIAFQAKVSRYFNTDLQSTKTPKA